MVVTQVMVEKVVCLLMEAKVVMEVLVVQLVIVTDLVDFLELT